MLQKSDKGAHDKAADRQHDYILTFLGVESIDSSGQVNAAQIMKIR